MDSQEGQNDQLSIIRYANLASSYLTESLLKFINKENEAIHNLLIIISTNASPCTLFLNIDAPFINSNVICFCFAIYMYNKCSQISNLYTYLGEHTSNQN